MTKRKPRPRIYKDSLDVGPLKVVVWPFPVLPPPKQAGRPVDPQSLARAEAAALEVVRQKAEEPRTSWTTLVNDVAADLHVAPERVWKALRKRNEYSGLK